MNDATKEVIMNSPNLTEEQKKNAFARMEDLQNIERDANAQIKEFLDEHPPQTDNVLSPEIITKAAEQLALTSGANIEQAKKIIEQNFKREPEASNSEAPDPEAKVQEVNITPPDSLMSRSISDEQCRIYDFGMNGNYRNYVIDDPKAVFIRPGGTTHRVLDGQGVMHCVPAPGYMNCVIRWFPKDINNPCAW